ncbi:MAG: tetraacyldisaccharide 4'-kinase [Cytophagaceae bacterium]|nr:tetraacyldisaccharide 4'-kinase [Cytophagaceae bacterium]
MILLRILLLPFSLIYLIITRFRNHLFNIGYKPSFHFDTKVINVGNLRVGGTGKTPHVEYLIRLLKDNYKIATLSRGYGRKTKGIIIANDASGAKDIGDEPFQFYKKFSKDIIVCVGEERALAIPTILHERENTEVIILDDAYQHRTVIPDLNILLSDYHNPFYKDIVLPSGRLRESRSGAKRADIIIVSKCPANLTPEEKDKIKKNIKRYSRPHAEIFFTGIKYNEPVSIYGSSSFKGKVLLVAGIANTQQMEQEVAAKFQLEKVLSFNDHHNYQEASIEKILKQFKEIKDNDKVILTTEKDMVKLSDIKFNKQLEKIPVFYLPIEIYFLDNKEKFDHLVLSCVQNPLNQ